MRPEVRPGLAEAVVGNRFTASARARRTQPRLHGPSSAVILPLGLEEAAHDFETFRRVLGNDRTTCGVSKREDDLHGRRR